MADPIDKIKVLHEAVSQKYDVGSLDEFKQKLQDPVKRKSFYEGVGSDYDLGDFNQFEEKVILKKKDSTIPSLGDQLLSKDSKKEPDLILQNALDAEQGGSMGLQNGSVSREQEYFDAFQDKLNKTKQEQFSKEVDDFKKKIGYTEPNGNFEDQAKYDEYKSKFDQVGKFAKSLEEKYNSDFASESQTELDRINKQYEAFQKQLEKFQDNRNPKTPEKFNPENAPKQDLLGSLAQKAYSGIVDMIPGGIASGLAGTELFTPQSYESYIANQSNTTVSTPMGPVTNSLSDEDKKKVVQAYILKVGADQYQKEKEEYENSGAAQQMINDRKALLNYSDEQDKEGAFKTQGIVSDTRDINSVSDAMSWAGGNLGQIASFGLAAFASGGTIPFLVEKGEGYKQSLDLIQQKTGLSRDQIINLDLDRTARENSTVTGAINMALENASNLVVFGKFIPKAQAAKFLTKLATSKGGKIFGSSLVEGSTEWIQGLDTKLGAMMATGKYKDVFEAVSAITPKEWEDLRQDLYAGMGGGAGMSMITTLSQQSKASKLSEIKTIRANRKFEAPKINEPAVQNSAVNNQEGQTTEGQSGTGPLDAGVNTQESGNKGTDQQDNQVAQNQQGSESTVQQSAPQTGLTNAEEPAVVLNNIQKLEEEYNSKPVDELVALKKKLYPNPDIESPMSPKEKLLNKVIAKKYSDINNQVRIKREENKNPQTPNATEGQNQNDVTNGEETNGQGRQEGLLTANETTGESPLNLAPENKSPEAPAQEGQTGGQTPAVETKKYASKLERFKKKPTVEPVQEMTPDKIDMLSKYRVPKEKKSMSVKVKVMKAGQETEIDMNANEAIASFKNRAGIKKGKDGKTAMEKLIDCFKS